MSGSTPREAEGSTQRHMTVMQATFIGVGSMVGAGIFALLGAAGAVAGSAVWVSFLLAGAIAGLQGYSFAKLGSTYPSGGGIRRSTNTTHTAIRPSLPTSADAARTKSMNSVPVANARTGFGTPMRRNALCASSRSVSSSSTMQTRGSEGSGSMRRRPS